MPMKPIVPALRTFRNRTHDIAKFDIRVPANHEIVVTDEVATGLDPRVFLEVGPAAEPPATEPADADEPAESVSDKPSKARKR